MIINFNKKLFSRKYMKIINSAFDYAIKLLKVPCRDLEVNVSFVGKKEIRKLNNEFRNIDKITDVLSFPNLLQSGITDEQLIFDKITKENFSHEINPENNCIVLGDIVICKKQVIQQSREYRTTKSREMVYMSVHGLLHLLGYDHMKDLDKEHMREVEEKIMKHVNLERK